MSSGQLDDPRSDAGHELDDLLRSLTRLGGVASALEAVVATPDRLLYRRAAGFRTGGETLETGSRFDAASLTKPWMSTLALALDASGALPLASRLTEVFPEHELPRSVGEATLEALLRHTAGMLAWAPLGVRLAGRLTERRNLERLLLSEDCWTEPTADTGSVYSDLGYMLWGLAAERRTGTSLASLLDADVCAVLGIDPIGASSVAPSNAVECRLDNGKEVELARAQGVRLSPQRSFHLGRPQDGNARQLAFATAHAGLFVTADEMLALGREWLRPARLISLEARDAALAGSGSHALGWARSSVDGSSGSALSPRAFGHTGFTGGSLWIDPESDRVCILLGHRLSSRVDFNPFRREFHRLAAALA